MAKKGKRLGKFEDPQLNNASKTLLANIRFASIDERVKTIAVTSTISNEGKTTVSTNLATAIATSGKRVLLIDADMRRRCIGQILGVHPANGLYAVLSGSATLNETIVSTSIPNLYFMDCEPNVPNPPDILSTKRFAALVDNLRESFDYVILDTPPVSLFVDAAVVSNLVDGTLFVIRQGFAKRTMTQNCIQQLNAANARILGCVMTFCENEESSYYYAYYTQDGKRVDARERDNAKATPSEFSNVDLNTWSRQAGINVTEHTSRAARTATDAGTAPTREERTPRRAAGHSAASQAAPAPHSVPVNPYATGAFKALGSSTNKKPRHKNTRM